MVIGWAMRLPPQVSFLLGSGLSRALPCLCLIGMCLLFHQGIPDYPYLALFYTGLPAGEGASQPNVPEEAPWDQTMEEGGEAGPAKC